MPSELASVAGSPVTHRLSNQTLELRRLSLIDLGTLEEMALREYRRSYLETFNDYAQTIKDEKERMTFRINAVREAAKIGLDDLPEKKGPAIDDAGNLTEQAIPYVQWWISKSFSGMLHFVWLSVRHAKPGLTIDQVSEWIEANGGISKLKELVNIVDEISSPSILGNSQERAEK